MKEIHRSKRTRLSYRRHHQQFPRHITKNDNDNDDSTDESDFEDEIIQQKSIIRSNKNANQMPMTLFDTISTLPIENKPHITIPSSSDQSSLFLYSINSIPKPTAISDDLTPLTVTTTTNTSTLTILTSSNTKQTEIVKTDLTELTSNDTLNTSDHDHSLSLNRKLSSVNINKTMQAYDTDTSMKSVIFSKQNSLEDELLREKYTSCFTIPGIQIEDSMAMETSTIQQNISLPTTINTNVNTCQRLPVKWNPFRWSLPNITRKFKLLIVCSSLSLIVGIVILIIIL